MEKELYMEVLETIQVAAPVHCSTTPANQDKQVDRTHSHQQVVVVAPVEAGMGTHHGKEVVVAAVVEGYRVGVVSILMWPQAVQGAAEHMLLVVAAAEHMRLAAAAGNKVLEGGAGWVLAGKMFFEAVARQKGNCKCLNSYHLEN